MINTEHSNFDSFYDTRHTALSELFDLLELPAQAKTSLTAAVDATQPWIKGDHVQPTHQFVISDQYQARLYELFGELGLTEKIELESRHYDEIVVLGGVHGGNNRRMAFLTEALDTQGVTTDQITMLGGQRNIFWTHEGSLVDQNIDALQTRDSVEGWVGALLTGKAVLRNETDLLRLAAEVHLGHLSLEQLHLRLDNADSLLRLEYLRSGIPVTISHTLAVARNGEPRHTTEACMIDWLQYRQPQPGKIVAFIAANPHIARTVRSARAVLVAHDRSDIELIAAGPAAGLSNQPPIYLGEVARNLYEDLRSVS